MVEETVRDRKMRKPRRIRRIVKWAGVGTCAVVVVTWFVSLERWLGAVSVAATCLHFHRGFLVVDHDLGRERPKFFVFPPYYESYG